MMRLSIPFGLILMACTTLNLFACQPAPSNSPENKPVTKAMEQPTALQPPRMESFLKFGSMITRIFEDSRGDFWIGSHSDGICRYDGEQFYYYTIDQGLPKGWIAEYNNRRVPMGNQIRYIKEDSKGQLVVGTGNGVAKFDGQYFEPIPVEPGSQHITEFFRQSPEAWAIDHQALYFNAGSLNGVYRYDGNQLIHLTFPIEPGREISSFGHVNAGESRYVVYSHFRDAEGNRWFGGPEAGIFHFDGTHFTCVNQEQPKGIVRAFYQDTKGRIWIANNLAGLCYYEDGSFHNYARENGYYNLQDNRDGIVPEDEIIMDGFQSFVEDEQGKLWLGTYGDGLWWIADGEIGQYSTDDILPNDCVKTVFKDRSGKLWFGMGDGRAYHLVEGAFVAL